MLAVQLVVSEPLPLGPLGLRKTCLYDLHAAHVTSGATDTAQVLPLAIRKQKRLRH